MNGALGAVLVREGKIRATNLLFIFWDLLYLVQALLTVLLSAAWLRVEVLTPRLPLVVAATIVGTAGWFFFYAIFELWIRRNDAFNTVTSAFYFFFLFASSMFYPLDPLPRSFQAVALANPITWHVDVLHNRRRRRLDGRARGAGVCRVHDGGVRGDGVDARARGLRASSTAGLAVGSLKRKRARELPLAPLETMPAATYSPTQFPMQYHRR